MSNNHRSYSGSSGRGKNTSGHEDILRDVVGKSFLHYASPRQDNTFALLKLLYGRYQKVLVDDLTATGYVLPL